VRVCVACGNALQTPDWRCAACGWQARVVDGVATLLSDGEIAEAFSGEQIDNLEAVDPRHFWFAARNQLIAWALTRQFPDARTILEVGCGTGPVLRSLADARPDLTLTGTEVSDHALRATARVVPSAALVRADTRSLPYDQEFDVVGAFDVLEHIPDDGEAMRMLARAARPGGGVMVTVPQHRWLWSPVDDYSGHQRRYRRAELVALARAAGLHVVLVTSFVSLLLPLMLLSRVMNRGRAVEPRREFAVSTRANRALMAIMRAELATIRAGLSWPAGGSLLLVAKRI
jgi:2-polyprenyl-3-methyl-5-hydroxy-6-metoxy-1,4-benzoquinol methylase